MNAYRHALETMQYALNDNGGLAWLKHNQAAVLKALMICDKIETLAAQGHKTLGIYDDGDELPISNTDMDYKIQLHNSLRAQNPADVFSDVVPPIHEIQVDPVPDALANWQDAEEQD